MTRRGRICAIAILSLPVFVASYAGWTHIRSPRSAASEDAYPVWIVLLKGLGGEARYVGSDDTHAYFRLGYVFWCYHKVPACMAYLPEVFPLESNRSYVAELAHLPNHSPAECSASAANGQ